MKHIKIIKTKSETNGKSWGCPRVRLLSMCHLAACLCLSDAGNWDQGLIHLSKACFALCRSTRSCPLSNGFDNDISYSSYMLISIAGLARKVQFHDLVWKKHCIIVLVLSVASNSAIFMLSIFSGLQRNRFRQRMPQFHVVLSLRNKHIISTAIANNSKKLLRSVIHIIEM